MTKFDRAGLQKIYATKIKPEEILYLVKEMARLHEEGSEPDWYSMVFILSDRYKRRMSKVLPIVERMGCLVEIMKDERMRGWSMQAIEKDCLLTNDAVFKGVALCPMKQDDDGKRLHFDPDEFFNIVLQQSESQGRA
jgi:hypothetical protein